MHAPSGAHTLHAFSVAVRLFGERVAGMGLSFFLFYPFDLIPFIPFSYWRRGKEWYL
jgi:hypothetical protein